MSAWMLRENLPGRAKHDTVKPSGFGYLD